MLGNHELLERRLRKHGQAATATVVSCDQKLSANENRQDGIPVAKYLCKVDLRVEPPGEQAFGATTESWFRGSRPGEGSVVGVLYDPSDHGKVVVDHSPEAESGAAIDSAVARRVDRGGDPQRMAGIGDLMHQAAEDPDGFRKMMREKGPEALGLSGHMQGAPAMGDSLGSLSKLGDLHDRGVLTDAEFEAQKKKLLGE
jgi:hypothetical protein